MLTVGSLFSGIGGLDLGLERAGMAVRWQCEADPYCRAVLRKHWPDVPCYEDVKTLDIDGAAPRGARGGVWAGLGVDILAGGFPCQPVSLAGRRRGASDERWLWPEFARLIRLLRPRYALMENVPGLLAGGGMAEVLGDLAACGYDAEWDCVAAANVGAPHLRYRVFIVAYPCSSELRFESGRVDGAGRTRSPFAGIKQAVANADRPERGAITEGRHEPDRHDTRWQEATGGSGVGSQDMADADDGRRTRRTGQLWPRRWRQPANRRWWATEPDVGRVAHGVPSRVDRLRALGNAVVPQVAEYVGWQIVAHAEGEAA